MKSNIKFAGFLGFVALVTSVTSNAGIVEGNLQTWHTISVTFEGPQCSEADPTTFLNNRLTVTFSNGDSEFNVPGYFAADGSAGNSHATSGNKWRVLFTPDHSGDWNYSAEFVTGEQIAISDEAGTAMNLADASGSFVVKPSSVSEESNDFRGKGRLQYVGKHYQQFSGSGTYFIKGGLGSPENLLAFDGIDGTYDAAKRPDFPALGEDQLHHYGPHQPDWKKGNPLWTDEDGQDSKGIIGVINYMAEMGMNSQYLMPLTYEGDGCDIWPWIDPTKRDTFDVSKLAQWDWIFSHMQHQGIHIHMLLTETENENLFELRDGGAPFSDTRKLYFRELIARFSHHLALTWDLGEENGWDDEKGEEVGKGNSSEQRRIFASFIKTLDPYKHPLKIHEIESVDIYTDLVGFSDFDGPVLQRHNNYNEVVASYVEMSRESGHPWLVSMDEPLGWEFGLRPDIDDPTREVPRKETLWGTLMAGGEGVEWYFGWQNNAPTSDLSSEDLRVRESMWKQTKVALDFFNRFLPFQNMRAANELVRTNDTYVFADKGQTYAIYIKQGGSASLDLADTEGTFDVRWFDPIRGGDLQLGSVESVQGASVVSLGEAPHSPDQDWAVLVTK